MSRLFLAARLFVNTFRFPFGPAPVVFFSRPGCFLPQNSKPSWEKHASSLGWSQGTHPPSHRLVPAWQNAPENLKMEWIWHWGLGVIQQHPKPGMGGQGKGFSPSFPSDIRNTTLKKDGNCPILTFFIFKLGSGCNPTILLSPAQEYRCRRSLSIPRDFQIS